MTAYPDDASSPSPARAELGRHVGAALRRNPMLRPIANAKVEAYTRPGFLSPAECQALIAQIDATCQPSSLFSGTGNALYRTSSSGNLDALDPLVFGISQRINANMAIDPDHGETLQGQRYDVGQEYKAHHDHFPANASYWPAMRDSGGQRCWTAMIYLNAVPQGGETHFMLASFMVPPTPGMLLIWNNLLSDGSPNPDTAHAALPVREGRKYVVTKWYRERPWTP